MFKLTIYIFIVFFATLNNIIFCEDFQNKIFEDEITTMFNCTRQLLKEGIPEVGLPSLERIDIPHLEINLDDFGISGATGFIILDNTVISGLTDLELSDLHFDPILIGGFGLSIKAKVTLPLFTVTTDYEGDFTIKSYEIWGVGAIQHEMKTLAINFDAELMFNNVHRVNLSKFRAVPSVENVKMNVSGFLNDDEQSALLSQLVDEEATTWVNGKSEDIGDVIEQFVQSLVNIDIVSKSLSNDYLNMQDIINAILEKCPLK